LDASTLSASGPLWPRSRIKWSDKLRIAGKVVSEPENPTPESFGRVT
jgi:hypothetical protein